jgi:hypothetical protein
MQTLQNKINDAITLKIERVSDSTGSLHTISDVVAVLESLRSLINDEFRLHEPEVVHTGITIETIRDIIEKIDVEDFCSVDNDSAEFELSYRNQVELCNVDLNYDSDALINLIEEGIEALTEQSHPITETQVI